MENVRTLSVEIIGETPLLMHADNIEWADFMEDWKNESANKKVSKAGDDRTPAWRWIGCLNFDDPKMGIVTVPSEYIMASIMGGAVKVPTGKGKGTFKALSQSGIVCSEAHWPLLVNGKTVAMKEVNLLKEVKDFKKHTTAVQDLGFSLFVKRAGVNGKKHVRVRPRFDNWSTRGELLVTDVQITDKVIKDILEIAGRVVGLGDWRPGAPKKPGPFGMFKATVLSAKIT